MEVYEKTSIANYTSFATLHEENPFIMTIEQANRTYWLFGGLGSALMGFGLSLLVESGFIKHSDRPDWHWVVLGTVSLVLIMSGINFLFRSFEAKLIRKEKKSDL